MPAGFNLAYLHVVEEDGAPESGPRFDVGGLRDLWNGPYIVNGDYDYSRAIKVIADGRADFVSFGKVVPRESGPAPPFCASCAAQRTGSGLVVWRRRSRIYRLSLSGGAAPRAAAGRAGGRRPRGASCVQSRSFSIIVTLLAGEAGLVSSPLSPSRR